MNAHASTRNAAPPIDSAAANHCHAHHAVDVINATAVKRALIAQPQLSPATAEWPARIRRRAARVLDMRSMAPHCRAEPPACASQAWVARCANVALVEQAEHALAASDGRADDVCPGVGD
jgi:hypothetical protein